MSSEIVSKPVDLGVLKELEGEITGRNSFSFQVEDALDALKGQGIELSNFGLLILGLVQLDLNKWLAEELLTYPGYLNFPNDPAQALREKVFPTNFHDLLEARWPNHRFEVQYVLGGVDYYHSAKSQYRLPFQFLSHYLRVVIREKGDSGGGPIRAVFDSFGPFHYPQSLLPKNPDFSQVYVYPGGRYKEFDYNKNGGLRKILYVPFYLGSVHNNYYYNVNDKDLFREGSLDGPTIYEMVNGEFLNIPAIKYQPRPFRFYGTIDSLFQALMAKSQRDLSKRPLGLGLLFVKTPQADDIKSEVEDNGSVIIKGALQIPYYDLPREKGKRIGIPKKWFYENNPMEILGIDPRCLRHLEEVVNKRGEKCFAFPFTRT